jgi:hypothetical protein
VDVLVAVAAGVMCYFLPTESYQTNAKEKWYCLKVVNIQ